MYWWKLIGPAVVSASKLGAVLPRRRRGISVMVMDSDIGIGFKPYERPGSIYKPCQTGMMNYSRDRECTIA